MAMLHMLIIVMLLIVLGYGHMNLETSRRIARHVGVPEAQLACPSLWGMTAEGLGGSLSDLPMFGGLPPPGYQGLSGTMFGAEPAARPTYTGKDYQRVQGFSMNQAQWTQPADSATSAALAKTLTHADIWERNRMKEYAAQRKMATQQVKLNS